jgi:hypothetical protein
VARFDPRQALEDHSLVEGHHQGHERIQRYGEVVPLQRLRERLAQNGSPLGVDARDLLAQLRPAPGERLELVPDALVAAVGVEVVHRRAPLLDERRVAPIHMALALDQPLSEALEHADEQVLDRAEVVMHEAVVGSGLLS